MKVLIVEEMQFFGQRLAAILKTHRFDSDIAQDGETGLAFAESELYDCIILGIDVKLINGFDFIKKLRDMQIFTPIILLSSRNSKNYIIKALDLGADDYITRPFDTDILIARIGAVTRRHKKMKSNNLYFNGLTLDRKSGSLKYKNEEISLSLKEFQIMESLMANPNQILTKDRLLEKIWGFDSNAEYNNLEVYISFLRKKLKTLGTPVKIITRRGAGYCIGI